MPPKRKQNKSLDGVTDYTKMKVAELKSICTSRGLDCKGTKAHLVKVLLDDDGNGLIGGKRVKQEKEDKKEEEMTMKEKLQKMAAADKASNVKRNYKIDSSCYLSTIPGATIHSDYDCMLNQTNIGHNNNKYYVIQLINCNRLFYVWNKWGRVGEGGQNALKGPFSSAGVAIKEFEKKFKDKTKNNWEDRENFLPVYNKYTLLEIESTDEVDAAEAAGKLSKLEGNTKQIVKPCTLDKVTKALIDLIFNEDMFKEAMQDMNIDIKKMPLGKLSKSQIAKGFEVLEKVEEILDKGSAKKHLEQLSSEFYTLIPHNFGRVRPPVIVDKETLRKKMEMLLVLGDIEIAQGLKTEAESQDHSQGEYIDHPTDINYGLLTADLELLSEDSNEYKVIKKNCDFTKDTYRIGQILNVWKVNRHTEGQRFEQHDSIDNRKLLWHGTNVAVVAAILKSGLRIMPHSGGRVGRGIYFASEQSKSAGYVSCSRNGTGIMFLNEVALGKEHSVVRNSSSLVKAPQGFDSVVARGRTEPDPKKDTVLVIDGKNVTVPQGAPIQQQSYADSSFYQSEYLVYKESQARIRYLLTFKFR